MTDQPTSPDQTEKKQTAQEATRQEVREGMGWNAGVG